MMVKEKRDMRPVVLKLGVAVVISFGGILYTFFRTRRFKPSSDNDKQPHPSGVSYDDHVLQRTHSSCNSTSVGHEKHEDNFPPKCSPESFSSGRSNGDKDAYLLPEFNELVDDFGFAAPKAGHSSCQDTETLYHEGETPRSGDEPEARSLRNMVKSLEERERDLEFQLLEYYGLKEQEAVFVELQNRLKISNMEAKLYSLKIESLQADKRRLEALAVDHEKVSAELEAAKAKIKLLKKKIRIEHEQNKEQILALQERVRKLREEESKAVTATPEVQLILQKLKDLEEEGDELRKSNRNLRLENSELAQKLELATSALGDEEERQRLRQENEALIKEIERLQTDRCTDAEELVYLRWINACLRYELRNFQPGPGKTIARDLSKNLSPKSEEKAKQLILEYATKEGLGEKGTSCIDYDSDLWSSSQASYLTDSGEFEDSSLDLASGDRTHTSSKAKVFGKLRKLLLHGKDTHDHSRSASVEMTSSIEDTLRRYSGVSSGSDRGPDQMNNRTNDERYLSIFRSFDSIAENAPAASSVQLNRHDQDPKNLQKSELAKYAQALKGSRRTSGRRRSAAFASF